MRGLPVIAVTRLVLLVAAVAAVPVASRAAVAAHPPPAAAPVAGPRAAPEEQAAPEEEAPDADVLGFLFAPDGTASRDAGERIDWSGPGSAQLKLSWDSLDKRNDDIATAQMMVSALVSSVQSFYDKQGSGAADAIRARLKELAGAPLEEARAAYLQAAVLEERRLFFVTRALAEARSAGEAIPGVDRGLVDRRVTALRRGAVNAAITARIEGYRSLALSIVAWLGGNNLVALQKMQLATERLPDVAVAHAMLGSLYFVFNQKDPAIVAWRRAIELDPANVAVREALNEYDRRNR